MERGGSTTRSGLVRFDPCMCSSPPRVSVNWVGHYDRLAPDFSRPFRYNTKFLPKLREVKSTEEEVADNGIPKILHHIWLGGELPPHFQLLRQVMVDLSSPQIRTTGILKQAFGAGLDREAPWMAMLALGRRYRGRRA